MFFKMIEQIISETTEMSYEELINHCQKYDEDYAMMLADYVFKEKDIRNDKNEKHIKEI